MVKALTTEEFIKRAKEKYGDLYNYSKVDYKNSKDKVIIICPDHGEFEQIPSNHLRGHNCLKCSGNLVNTDDFIKRARLKHGERYDYSKVEYKSNKINIIITCSEHGDFEQLPCNHLSSGGCSLCSGTILNTQEFIKRSILKHNNFYDYSKVIYKNSKDKVIIICPEHGEFEQIAGTHLKGKNCLKCTDRRLSQEEFIRKSNLVHFNKYSYDNTIYVNTRTKVIISCQKHGDFEQLPRTHLKGSGCFKCSFNISKISINWLNYIQNTINKEIQNMLSPLGEYKIPTTLYKADGYCKETNTIYEFHGDLWHGNPKKYKPNDINPLVKKTYGELYKRTQLKKEKILELGYNYIEIWEQDWIKAIKAVTKIQKIWKKKNYKNGDHLRVVKFS
jgi:hypothetical protein